MRLLQALTWGAFIAALLFLVMLEGITGMFISAISIGGQFHDVRGACVQGLLCQEDEDCRFGGRCVYVENAGRSLCTCDCNYDGACDAPERYLSYCPDCGGKPYHYEHRCYAGMPCGKDEACGEGKCMWIGSRQGIRKTCVCPSLPYGGIRNRETRSECVRFARCTSDRQCGQGYCKRNAFSIGQCVC